MHRYAYDHLGNVRVKQVEIEGLAGTKTATYDHDLAGRVTRLVYPDGAQARYAYDGAGRLSRVGDANGNTLATYTHTAAGNIETHVAGEDIVTGTYTYNPREWVTDIDYAGKFSSELTYDLAGNVTRQEYSHGGAASKTADYAYDALYRITGFDLTGGTSRDYAYDRSGNLTPVVTGSSRLTYNYSGTSTPNRLDSTTGTGGQTYAYNQNGWMTRKGADTLTYDYRGLTTGYGSARYLMDPDRRRVKKTVGTAITYYLRGPGGSVLAEYAGQSLSARYVYAGSRRIARIAGSSASYYLVDHLGSTRSLVGEEGAVTAAYDYWPYGKVLASSGSGATHFRFTGHERDPESGLDYMPARSYAYDVGRFLRPDPMQDEYPGISPYAYAANNPLKYVDPDGRLLWKVVTKGYKIGKRAYAAAKKGKSLLKKDTWKDIKADEIANLADNISTLTDETINIEDVIAVIDLATDLGDEAKKLKGILSSTNKPKGGDQVYRVFGGESGPHGRSWTRTNPGSVNNYRDAAGLPDSNTGQFVAEGRLKNTKGVTQRDALPLDGNKGGIDEVLVPDPVNQIEIDRVSGVNPEF